MKIWDGYGSEHSMNLVMIGHFKTEDEANKTQEIIDKLSIELSGKIDIGTNRESYTSEVMNILKEVGCFILGPGELEHFLYDIHTHVDGNKVILKTDETDVSAFFKLMIDNGAKVEVYSAHFHPDEKYGRGK